MYVFLGDHVRHGLGHGRRWALQLGDKRLNIIISITIIISSSLNCTIVSIMYDIIIIIIIIISSSSSISSMLIMSIMMFRRRTSTPTTARPIL